MSSINYDSRRSATTLIGLYIAPVFTIWTTGTLGAAFPILAHRSRVIRIPRTIFEYIFHCTLPFLSLTYWHRFAKYFSSGVIIATAITHLLIPAISKLTSPCLGAAWKSHVSTLPVVIFLVIPILICSPSLTPRRLPSWHPSRFALSGSIFST